MEYLQYLTRIVDDGIAAAKKSYEHDQPKLAGAVTAFETCRNKSVEQLTQILKAARQQTARVRGGVLSDYWRARVYEAEVEWVCNCVSVVLFGQGKPTVVAPTARAFLKASQVLGVAPAGTRTGAAVK